METILRMKSKRITTAKKWRKNNVLKAVIVNESEKNCMNKIPNELVKEEMYKTSKIN